jgi:hypothetical protein
MTIGKPFEYPYRVHPIIATLWDGLLAHADNEYAQTVAGQGGNPYDGAFEVPSQEMTAKVGPFVDQALAYLEDRDRALEDYLNGLTAGGGGLRPATVTVGCSTSRDTNPGHYDYFIPASVTDPETAIQEAITATDSNAGGPGDVLIFDGLYSLSAAFAGFTAPNSFGVDVRGVNNGLNAGGPGTMLGLAALTAAGVTFFYGFNRISNLRINPGSLGAKTIIGVDQALFVDHVNVTSPAVSAASMGIRASADSCIDHNWLNVLGGIGIGLDMTSGSQRTATVHDNNIIGCAVGLGGDGGASDFGLCDIHGNIIHGCTTAGVILPPGLHDSNIHDNSLYQNESAQFDVDGTDNFVHDNQVRQTSHPVAIGMRVKAGATTNTVINNDLHDSGATPFSDLGTGTIKNLDGSAAVWNRV